MLVQQRERTQDLGLCLQALVGIALQRVDGLQRIGGLQQVAELPVGSREIVEIPDLYTARRRLRWRVTECCQRVFSASFLQQYLGLEQAQ